MTNKGSKLEMKQSLSIGDYLISDNGCFRAIMQDDGNFVIYQVADTGEDCIWASGVWPGSENGPYTAAMQDDGNFVIYQKNGHPIWATNTKWDLARVELSNISYDFDHFIMKDRPDLLSEVTRVLINDTNVEQDHSFSLEYQHAETDSWSHGLDLNAGVEMKVRAGIPCIINGKVGTAGGGTYRHTTEKLRSTLKKYAALTSGKVPPHSQVICRASLSTVQITLPYTSDAIYHLKNGKRLRGKLKGGYQGTKAYQTQVSWSNKNGEIVPL